MYDFNYARIPPIYFGTEKIARLPVIASELGAGHVLLVTGKSSLQTSGKFQSIQAMLQDAGLETHSIICPTEPSTTFVDKTCAQFRAHNIDVVIGIGGGSVIDAGKAVSAMLPHDNSIFDHLEGVGPNIAHSGIKKPYIAIPTTSGTGSEVTKNAVISEVGPAGYKKSLRHDNLIPDAVVVDGDLLVSCPQDVTFACGMDAFTQLLEPYLSPKVSPLTETLVWSGFKSFVASFPAVCESGSNDEKRREGMAYTALLSGVALANDGVGIVHGLASPIGGFFPIPHGVVCATLVAPSVRANLAALRARDPESPAIRKMACLGALLSSRGDEDEAKDCSSSQAQEQNCDALLEILDKWTVDFSVPRLSRYGICDQDLEKILNNAQNRNNPVTLTQGEIRKMLEERL